MAMKAGDKVRFRDDATTEGQPIGELFMKLTWTVVAINETRIEIASRYLSSDLKMHTLTHKLRPATPEEIGQ
jgi:hypothetical protein